MGRGSDPTPLEGTAIHLMTFIITPLDDDEAVFTINDGGLITPYPGHPIYTTGIGDPYAYAMNPYPDGSGEKVFVINGAVPNESLAWGQVKALYDR